MEEIKSIGVAEKGEEGDRDAVQGEDGDDR